jgi:hypothetical protein
MKEAHVIISSKQASSRNETGLPWLLTSKKKQETLNAQSRLQLETLEFKSQIFLQESREMSTNQELQSGTKLTRVNKHTHLYNKFSHTLSASSFGRTKWFAPQHQPS